jgi:hypothetical protein
MRRSGGLLALAILSLSACDHPCRSLDERVCADLGEACGEWRGDAQLRASYLPADGQLTMRKSDGFRCEMYVADENYATHTLPSIRYRLALKRNPSQPAPNLSELVPVDGVFSGVSGPVVYVLPVASVVGMFLYMGWYRRKTRGVTRR